MKPFSIFFVYIGYTNFLGGFNMIEAIPWQFKPLPFFDTTINIHDDNTNLVGTIELGTEGLTKKTEKRSIIGKKEVFVRQNNILLKNGTETIKVKATCNRTMTSVTNRVLDRSVEYEKDGNLQTIKLSYHNETVKYFYSFSFNNEEFHVFFSDDGLTFEILKDKSFVAKYQQLNEDNQIFEVETAFKGDCWLWLTLFIHLHYNFNRNRGIVFRGMS